MYSAKGNKFGVELIGGALGAVSLILFMTLFYFVLASNPILGARYFVDRTDIFSALTIIAAESTFYLVSATLIGFLLTFSRRRLLRCRLTAIQISGLTFVHSIWFLLYSPAFLLLLNCTLIDFVKYDHTFRDRETGSMLVLGGMYWALVRWGIVLGVIYVPISYLISVIEVNGSDKIGR